MAVSQRKSQGLETSMGYVAWLGKYEREDSILTTFLRKAGALRQNQCSSRTDVWRDYQQHCWSNSQPSKQDLVMWW